MSAAAPSEPGRSRSRSRSCPRMLPAVGAADEGWEAELASMLDHPEAGVSLNFFGNQFLQPARGCL